MVKYYIFLIVSVVFIASSCGTRNTTDDRQIVTVTIAPLKYVIDRITGNELSVNVLVPAGASPETYEPTPQQIIELSNSKLIFSTGLIDFEQQLGSKLSEASSCNIINLSEGIDVIAGSCSHDHNHANHAVSGIDPHIWTSPRLIQKMAETAYKKIALLYPESLEYHTNYIRLHEQLDSLDIAIKEKISNSKHDYFIIYHPALTYYANDYNIKQLALEEEGKEPSAAHLKEIISKAKNDKIKYIFFQSQFSRSAVEAVANEIGAQTIEIDPLSENVIENLDVITNLIIK